MLSDQKIGLLAIRAINASGCKVIKATAPFGTEVVPMVRHILDEYESAAISERDARIADLDRSLDVMAQNTEAQAHASLQREIELTEKVEKLTRELEEARKALETARNWIAERPDMRQCSAGKIVAELTLAIRAAIKEQT